MAEDVARVSVKCEQCGHEKVVPKATYTCDHCGETLPHVKPIGGFRVFRDGGKVVGRDYCGWGCLLADLADVQCDYFISLPPMHCDGDMPGWSREAFLAAVTAYGAEGGDDS